MGILVPAPFLEKYLCPVTAPAKKPHMGRAVQNPLRVGSLPVYGLTVPPEKTQKPPYLFPRRSAFYCISVTRSIFCILKNPVNLGLISLQQNTSLYLILCVHIHDCFLQNHLLRLFVIIQNKQIPLPVLHPHGDLTGL